MLQPSRPRTSRHSRGSACPLCGGRRRLWWPWRQHGATHSRFKSRVAEEMVAHVYLCVGAVGVFFDFVTTTASSQPVSLSTSALPSTRPCSLRRNLIGRAKYTEPD